ncbi:MAG TPA: HhH-GPD-type base excision DNA repair protein [Gaiellaceae bacterium]|nr:HhH-GPD-type base excision DNA repair protein [Gaiellaceae bacterium]
MPDRLYFTDDDEANELLVREPMALLIGFALDQQVPVQKAFYGPKEILDRVGTLDANRLAELDLEDAFRQKPAIHRFPGAMAKRVQELAQVVADEYGGDASRLWTEASDGAELRRRIEGLPGFGEMKVKALGAVLAKRFGVETAQALVPTHPTLGDVDSPGALAAYQDAKRAHKAKIRAGQEATW